MANNDSSTTVKSISPCGLRASPSVHLARRLARMVIPIYKSAAGGLHGSLRFFYYLTLRKAFALACCLAVVAF